MTNRSKHASVFTDYFRDFGALLFDTAQRLYEAHMERAQMRLAHTRYLDGLPPAARKSSRRFG